MRNFCAALVVGLTLLYAQGAYGDTVTSVVPPGGTATYDGYYAWGSGASWDWYAGGNEAHYYSDCYPCYFWSNTRVYLEVPLPAVSGNILSATLFVDVTGFANYAGDGRGAAAFWHQANSSGLTGNAYNDRASLSAGEYIQNITVSGTGWLGLPVTSFVSNDYAAGYSYSTFAFTPTGDGYGNSAFTFTAPGEPNSPYLSVMTDAASAVPEPASFLLFAIGGAGLFLASRRR